MEKLHILDIPNSHSLDVGIQETAATVNKIFAAGESFLELIAEPETFYRQIRLLNQIVGHLVDWDDCYNYNAFLRESCYVEYYAKRPDIAERMVNLVSSQITQGIERTLYPRENDSHLGVLYRVFNFYSSQSVDQTDSTELKIDEARHILALLKNRKAILAKAKKANGELFREDEILKYCSMRRWIAFIPQSLFVAKPAQGEVSCEL